jgi:hypothetical protein
MGQIAASAAGKGRTKSWITALNPVKCDVECAAHGAGQLHTEAITTNLRLEVGRGGLYHQRYPSTLLPRHPCYVARIIRRQSRETVVRNRCAQQPRSPW